MLYKFQYNSGPERDILLTQNSDKILIGEQNITEGNFLIFSDTPQPLEAIMTTIDVNKISDMEFNQSQMLLALVNGGLM